MGEIKNRVIPIILWDRLGAVTSIQFKKHRRIGSLEPIVKLHVQREVDELVFLDIRASGDKTPIDVANMKVLSRNCFVPLTLGGGIHTVPDAKNLFRNGADKIAVNSGVLRRPELVTDLANEFGSSSVVVSIDAMWNKASNSYSCFTDAGTQDTGRDVLDWAQEVEARGAGEILVCSIANNGQMKGLDLQLVKLISSVVSVPVIASGGVGSSMDAVNGIVAGAQAIGASSVFQFSAVTPEDIRRELGRAGFPVRAPAISAR